MDNIFENAYFGKPYKTRGGDKALFQYKDTCQAHLITESEHIDVYLDGIIDSRFFDANLDIISEWEEPINEEELDEITKAYLQLNVLYRCDEDEQMFIDMIGEAHKAGYRKAFKKIMKK